MKSLAAALTILVLSSPLAVAYQVPAAPFSQGSATMPGSGLTQTISATGRTTLGVATTAGSRGLTATTYSPDLASDTPSQEILVRTGDCASTGPCANRGTMTIAFSQAVRDPILHIAGLGGVSSESSGGQVRRQSELHSILELTTAGVTLSKASTGDNFAVTGGDTITATDDDTGPACPTSSTGSGPPAKASAGCGSVRVNGAVTSLSFTITAVFTKNAVLPAFNSSTSGDAVSIVASVREDFGDAPSSYDAGNAARAVIGTVQLGAAVSEDNEDVANGTKSPNSSGDEDDDGVVLTPLPTTATSYSTTATVSGGTKQGRVCGWIDFDKSGTFESGERACASVGAGDRSATLAWTGLRGLTAGSTHARFRVGYQAAQVQSPTGASDSGEVEDYPFTIKQPEPPVATPDTGSTPQDVNVTVDPLSNDKAGTGSTLDPSSVCIVTRGTCVKSRVVPGEGTYTVNANGTVSFDPLPEFSGVASPVTYRVADSNGQTAASTITITVTPIKPEAIDDTGNTAYDTPVTTAVLSNDKPGHPSAPLVPSSMCIVDGNSCVKTHAVPGEGTYTVRPDGAITFDPAPGFAGKTTPITYRVADDNGATDTATLTITVALPPPPIAAPDTSTTPQNVDVTVNPLTNDRPGAPGVTLDPASVCIVSGGSCVKTHTIPGVGSYAVKPDGIVTFDPAPAFVGAASPVTYRVADSTGQTAASTITVTVTPVQPVANDDATATPFNTPVTVPVLQNDKPGSPDAPLVPSSVRLVDPRNGTLVVTLTVPDEGSYAASPDGTVTFTPVNGFAGKATAVTYHVADSNGTPTRARITVSVEKPEPPVANPDTGTTPQGVPVTTAVLANDTPGPSGSPLRPGSVRLIDPSTGLPVTTVTVPNEGAYTVDLSAGAIKFEPVPRFTGGATPVKYQVADGNGAIASSTVTITVTPVTPDAEDDAATTAYDTSIKLQVLDNDKPGSVDVPLVPGSVCLVGGSRCVKTVTVPNEGTYKVNPDGTVEFDPLPAFTGTATPLTYQVLDTNGTPAKATITVTVVKPPAPEAEPDTATTPQDISITVTPLANDTAGAGTTLDPASVCLVGGGTCVKTLTVPRQGTFIVNPDGTVGFDPLPTFAGTATPVDYRVSDALGQTATSTITITVTPIEPVVNSDRTTTPFDTNVTAPVLANDKPGDPSAPLDPASVCLVSGDTCVKTLTVPDQGTYAVQPNGSVTFDPADGFQGVAAPVTYRVADDNGSTGDATLTVTVGDAPDAKPDTGTTKQDVTVTVDPLANDEPGTGGTLDRGSVQIFDPGTKSWGKTVTVPGEGAYAVRPDGSITFDPLPGFIGQSSVPYRVTDSYGNTAASTVTVTVAPIKPQAIDDTSNTAYNTPVTVPVARNDKAGDPSAPLDPASACLVSGSTCVKTLTVPDQGTYTVQPDGSVRFVPVDGFRGTTTPVSYRIEDVRGTAARARLTITVGGPEGAEADPDRGSGRPGKVVVLHPLANDRPSKGAKWKPDTVCLGGACLKHLVVPDVGTWTVGKDGTIRFVSDLDFRGTAKIPYRVTDTYGVTVDSVVRVTIAGWLAPPGDDDLPDTGGPLSVLLIAGVLLIGVGGTLVSRSRRLN